MYCSFANNSATYGGSLNFDDAQVTMAFVSVSTSVADQGGAVYAVESDVFFANSSISNCSAFTGGAMYIVQSSTLTLDTFQLTNCQSGGKMLKIECI